MARRSLTPDEQARAVIGGLTAFVAALSLVNLAAPPANYGYLPEMALLLIVGLGALWISRDSIPAAVGLYFSLALLPVYSMLERYANSGAFFSWGPLELAAPIFGMLAVSVLSRDARAAIGYTIAALAASAGTGWVYNDAGAAGSLITMTSIAGAAGAIWCARESRKDVALETVDILFRGLGGIVEKLPND